MSCDPPWACTCVGSSDGRLETDSAYHNKHLSGDTADRKAVKRVDSFRTLEHAQHFPARILAHYSEHTFTRSRWTRSRTVSIPLGQYRHGGTFWVLPRGTLLYFSYNWLPSPSLAPSSCMRNCLKKQHQQRNERHCMADTDPTVVSMSLSLKKEFALTVASRHRATAHQSQAQHHSATSPTSEHQDRLGVWRQPPGQAVGCTSCPHPLTSLPVPPHHEGTLRLQCAMCRPQKTPVLRSTDQKYQLTMHGRCTPVSLVGANVLIRISTGRLGTMNKSRFVWSIVSSIAMRVMRLREREIWHTLRCDLSGHHSCPHKQHCPYPHPTFSSKRVSSVRRTCVYQANASKLTFHQAGHSSFKLQKFWRVVWL